jgi:hypothetical protein
LLQCVLIDDEDDVPCELLKIENQKSERRKEIIKNEF